MRLILFCTLTFKLFASSFDELTPSTPEEILSLTSDLLIDGFVSVTSGQIAISETDLVVRGAQDLVLKRTYIHPRVLGRYDDDEKKDHLALGKALRQLETRGWVVLPHLWAGINQNSRYFQVCDPQGFVLEFQIQGNKGVLKTASYGCTNLKGDTASSSNDLRNIEFSIEGNWIKIVWPDGLQRHYLKCGRLYRLEKEILTNGKMIRYEYNSLGVCKISSTDPTGNLTYAAINRVGMSQYAGSDGTEANFFYEKKEIKGRVKTNNRIKEKRTFAVPVMIKGSNPFYSNTIGYNERTLLNSYDSKCYPFFCTYFQNKNSPARIHTFSNPTGSFTFSYDPVIAGQKGGGAIVTHPDKVQTIYRFNKLFLLEGIENWFEGTLTNKKVFTYDSKQHIKRIETLDGEGNLLIAKHFECDESGNATLETREGDFGTFSIKCKFDNNRIVLEEYDNGLQYAFTYLGSTRLITSKIILDFGKQLQKTLFSYDNANNLIQIEEEGKTRTIYTLYQTAPHLHRIEWEEERDWDGELISKIHYEYDQWGNIHCEKHFDADGMFAFTIERTYNEKGDLLSETNPLQEVAVYKYDARGRCFYEEPFSNGLVIQRTFDEKGRLTLLQEDDQETKFFYNASDELIKKIDYLGFTTLYQVHPVHGKPTRIEEGTSVTEIKYDPFGRAIETIDSTNAKTIKRFNSYGDPIQITYPEGGIEFFSYHPNGLIKTHVDPDELTTTYTYDVLSRMKEKTVGKLATRYECDGYNLNRMIDPAGYFTSYKYDFIDRKIEEVREGRIIYYGYDALGFLNRIEQGEHGTYYTNDRLGRVRTKSNDDMLETSWTYDLGGNIATIKQGGTKHFRYDSHNRCLEKIDEENNKTVSSYEKGSEVLIERRVDPMGIEMVYTYNPQGKLLKKAIDGQMVEEFAYDSLFRLKQQDHISFRYTPNGNKESIQEASLRTTNWTYTPGNRTLSKQKPDGTTLEYGYNEQGDLTKIASRQFQYDQLGRLIGGSGFSRTLDPFGNILREDWSNGLWIETDYDELDRPLIRRLSDHSRIEYEYYGPFLKKVSRFSDQGKELYNHSFDHFDAKGNPCIENGLFQTSYEYDRKGRRISQHNPYYSEKIEYDALGNLVRKGNTTYTYDHLSQMTSESAQFTAAYDAHYNLRELNGQPVKIDSLNQIEGVAYDLNGNLMKPGFVYDAFDQLIEAGGERSTYDALGRRIQKEETSFLYIGDEEIGAFEKGVAKELKIPGGMKPIAMEINHAMYAPIIDVQGTIRSLVNCQTKKIVKQNDCDAFAYGLCGEIPYAYAGKRYDPKTGLIYFGKRFYDPSLRRWLTPDPIGAIDHSNLYQYVYNNPFRYQDPNGESAGGYLLGLGEIILGGAIMAGGFALEVVTVGGFTVGLGVTTGTGALLIGHGLSMTTINAQEIKSPTIDQTLSNLFEGVCIFDKSPPYDWEDLGIDPTIPPVEGFEWKGKGYPGSGKGSWVKGQRGNQEILYPDLNHPPPLGPHWDYESPEFPEGVRISPNGWSPK